MQHSQAIVYEDGKVHRLPPKDVASAPSHRATFRLPGSTITISSRPRGARATRVQYKPQQVAIPGTGQRTRADDLEHALREAAAATSRFFIGPKDFDVLEAADRRSSKRSTSASSRFLAVPLLRALKWINGYRRQLRLVDHLPHHPDQHRDVPAAPQERRVDAEDAGAAAADEGDPGSLREAARRPTRRREDEQELMALYARRA